MAVDDAVENFMQLALDAAASESDDIDSYIDSANDGEPTLTVSAGAH